VNPSAGGAGQTLTRARRGLGDYVETALPKIVLGPTLLCALIFVYGFIAWTAWLSFTESRILPRYDFAGLVQYITLFANDRWWTAVKNLGIFAGLFIAFCLVTGLLLAILLDQRIRAEGFLRAIYLYPMALSFIVTGTAWRWILNPGLGLEHLVRQLGFEHFTFDWIVTPGMSIYTVVIAGVWQSTGFVMALFLAGLRGIDDAIIKAAQVDGAGPVRDRHLRERAERPGAPLRQAGDCDGGRAEEQERELLEPDAARVRSRPTARDINASNTGPRPSRVRLPKNRSTAAPHLRAQSRGPTTRPR